MQLALPPTYPGRLSPVCRMMARPRRTAAPSESFGSAVNEGGRQAFASHAAGVDDSRPPTLPAALGEHAATTTNGQSAFTARLAPVLLHDGHEPVHRERVDAIVVGAGHRVG